MKQIKLKYNRIHCSLNRMQVRRVMEAIFSNTPKGSAKKKPKKKGNTTQIAEKAAN